jgi:hypothetical protein
MNNNAIIEDYQQFEEKEINNQCLNVINDTTLDSKQKIIKSLEIEYEYLEKQQAALLYSNDEMLKFDPNDYELIESRVENLKFMGKNMRRMKQIKDKLIQLDRDNRILINDDLKIDEEIIMRDSKNKNNSNINYNTDNIIKEIEI